jgi:hypothetical protein
LKSRPSCAGKPIDRLRDREIEKAPAIPPGLFYFLKYRVIA